MKIALPFAVLVAAGLAWGSPSARAWNGTGHEAVAQVAWDQLLPRRRAAIADVLRAHPRYEKDLMQHLEPGEDPDEHAFREAATWPDQVKTPTHPLGRTENHPNWHYVDYPYDRDGKAGPMPDETWDGQSVPQNLLQAMQKVTAELRDPATPPPRRAIDLCWCIHLVGDIHQPLHAVSLFSDTYPTGDQGGNLLRVRTADAPQAALHGVWDGIEGRSFEPGAIHQIASRAEGDYPLSEVQGEVADGKVKDWATESFELAKHDVYLDGRLNGMSRDQAADHPDDVPPLPVGYTRHARAVADRQIALAGYRLAALLLSLPMPSTQPAAATLPTVDPK